MSRLKIVKEQADESTYQDWRKEDYMNKMNFNPLVMFVFMCYCYLSFMVQVYFSFFPLSFVF